MFVCYNLIKKESVLLWLKRNPLGEAAARAAWRRCSRRTRACAISCHQQRIYLGALGLTATALFDVFVSSNQLGDAGKNSELVHKEKEIAKHKAGLVRHLRNTRFWTTLKRALCLCCIYDWWRSETTTFLYRIHNMYTVM